MLEFCPSCCIDYTTTLLRIDLFSSLALRTELFDEDQTFQRGQSMYVSFPPFLTEDENKPGFRNLSQNKPRRKTVSRIMLVFL